MAAPREGNHIGDYVRSFLRELGMISNGSSSGVPDHYIQQDGSDFIQQDGSVFLIN